MILLTSLVSRLLDINDRKGNIQLALDIATQLDIPKVTNTTVLQWISLLFRFDMLLIIIIISFAIYMQLSINIFPCSPIRMMITNW